MRLDDNWMIMIHYHGNVGVVTILWLYTHPMKYPAKECLMENLHVWISLTNKEMN